MGKANTTRKDSAVGKGLGPARGQQPSTRPGAADARLIHSLLCLLTLLLSVSYVEQSRSLVPLEISVGGQNLQGGLHLEYISEGPFAPSRVGRSFYGRATWRF
jgi:hypothetical protein